MAIGLQPISPIFTNLLHTGMDRRLVAVIDEISKVITSIWIFHDTYNTLSTEGAGGVIRSAILGLLTAGLADIGIPLDKVMGVQGLVLQGIADELAYWTDITPNPQPNYSNRSEFQRQLDQYLHFLVEGKAVANGPRPCRNALRCGDPVLLHRGEFERQAVDLQVNGAGIDFAFQRTYRSSVAYLGPLGPNWDHSYNLRLRQENDYVLVRLTGQLSEQRFVQHPRFGNGEFSYYIPPDGVHDVLVPDDDGESFVLIRPQGIKYFYQITDQPNEHRIKKIKDRFGNYLDFGYDPDDRLQAILINSPHRSVRFHYDEIGRLDRIQDHTGRVVVYTYDNQGYLDCAAGPARLGEKPARLERYEYDQVGQIFKLGRVWDWQGRIVVENEYEQDPLSDFFGYIVRQRENKGESTFFYDRITEEFDLDTPPRDLPVLRVWETRRNGHQVEHYLNPVGNELLRREQFTESCRIREAVTRRRYNADGQVIAQLDPDGDLTQYLYGRDHIAEDIDWPDIDPVFGDVPMKDRMSFGNLLATVIRGQRVAHSAAAADPSFWENRVPPVKIPDRTDPKNPDIVTKYRYDRDSQLLISKSDPRYTISADPLHPESASPGHPGYDPANPKYVAHQRHLTRFKYGRGPRFLLQQTVFPDRTRPSLLDGIALVPGIVEEIRRYDGSGRPLKWVDARGFEWFNEYYLTSRSRELRSKAGYLRRRLIPHIDWLLNNSTPDILEIQKRGMRRATNLNLLSIGRVGNHITISIEGVRIALYQQSNLTGRVGRNAQVEVRVDGNRLGRWDQTADAVFVIDGLPRGVHIVEVRDVTGIPFSIGRVRSHVSLDYEVNDLGHVTQETDALGNVTVNVVDVLGRKAKVTKGPAANASVMHYKYDPGDRVVLERAEWRDEDGRNRPEVSVIRRYHYDQADLLLSTSVGPEQGGHNRITRHHYDPEDLLRETINPRGNNTYFEYDALNRQIRTIRAACSPDRSATMTAYDLADRVLAQRDPRGALYFNGYRDHAGGWQSSIDTRGLVRVKTDPLGHMVVTDYDALGKPLIVRQFQRRPDGGMELLSHRDMDYDEHGDVIRATEAVFERPILTVEPVVDPEREFQRAENAGNMQSAVTEFHLDAHGNIVATRNPDNGIQRQHFDGQRRVFNQEDPEGRRTFRIYDGNGNVTRNYTFEPVRNPRRENISHYEVFLQFHEYDELNREITRIDPYRNRWEQRYDTLGNMTRTIDPLGNVVQFDYNAFGEEVLRTQERTQTGLGGSPALPPLITQREYDSNGNVLAIIDPAQRRTEFTYDLLDRLVESRFAIGPNEPPERRTYDPSSNLISITDRNGLVKLMKYDLLNRHGRTDIDTRGMARENTLSRLSANFALFTYDAPGRLIRHENEYCVVEMSLDSRGLSLSEKVTIQEIAGAPEQLEIVRRFDLAGRRQTLIYPSGRELRYIYDLLGRIASVRNVASPHDYPGRAVNAVAKELAHHRYVGHRLTGVDMGNGLILTTLFDGRGQLLERSVSRRPNGNPIWRMQRLRDAAGFTRVESAQGRRGARSRKFALDSIYQLTHYQDNPVIWIDPSLLAPPHSPIDPMDTDGQALIDRAIGPLEAPGGAPVYEYDEMGNRLQTREVGIAPIGSIPNELNQYAIVDGNPWQYDANGNLRSDSTYSFLYDLNNALQEVSNIALPANQATYYRDALGRVVAEITLVGTTFCISDGSIPLVEFNAAGRIEYTPDHLAESVFHAAHSGEDYWLIRDGLGSLRLLTDSQKRLVSIPRYRPYGSLEDGELAQSPLRFGFGSMWFTPNLPFLHSLTRSFKVDLGRYLQRDPAGHLDSLNLYSYVGNNPVKYRDPMGLQAEVEFLPDFEMSSLEVPAKPPLSLGDFHTKLPRFSPLIVNELASSVPMFAAMNFYPGWRLPQFRQLTKNLKSAAQKVGKYMNDILLIIGTNYYAEKYPATSFNFEPTGVYVMGGGHFTEELEIPQLQLQAPTLDVSRTKGEGEAIYLVGYNREIGLYHAYLVARGIHYGPIHLSVGREIFLSTSTGEVPSPEVLLLLEVDAGVYGVGAWMDMSHLELDVSHSTPAPAGVYISRGIGKHGTYGFGIEGELTINRQYGEMMENMVKAIDDLR